VATSDPKDEVENFIRAAEAGDGMIFECADRSLSSIAAMDSSWNVLMFNVLGSHAGF
jgi:hypothetical protein